MRLFGFLVGIVLIAQPATVAAAQDVPPGWSAFAGSTPDARIAPILDRHDGVIVWNERVDAGFVLVASVGGGRERLPIAPRAVPFDVDLGPGAGGGVVAAYSRCAQESTLTDEFPGLFAYWPYPFWTSGRGCDLYRYDFATRTESKITGASTDQASEMLPSIWRDEVAFARVYERRSGRRGRLPYLYVRRLGDGARSRRQPGGARGDIGVPGPTRLDLYGRRLSFVWNYLSDYRRSGPDSGVTQLRLDTVDRRHQVLSRARWGPGQPARGYASYVGPVGDHGRIYYGYQRAMIGEGESTSVAALLIRYRLSTGDRHSAAAPAFLIDFGIEDELAVAGADDSTFHFEAGQGRGSLWLRDGVAWRD